MNGNQSVKDTSLKAYDENQKLGRDQQIVYEAILNLGPTHDNRILEYLRQGEKQKPHNIRRSWEMSAGNGRRNQLVGKGVVRDMGKYSGLWNNKPKTYHFWTLVNCAKEPVGWFKTIERMPGWMQKFFKKKKVKVAVRKFTGTLF